MEILIGVILILIGGTIELRGHMIELTPNFIGSILLLVAMKRYGIQSGMMKLSIYMLTVLFGVNYILQIVNPEGLPVFLSIILTSGTLLWGIGVAVKLVKAINEQQGIKAKSKTLKIWFWILFGITSVIGIAMIFLLEVAREIAPMMLTLSFFIGVVGIVGSIVRYVGIYLFYKELNSRKMTYQQDTQEAPNLRTIEAERELEIAKELMDVLDDETIAMKTGVPIEKVRELRQENN
ncbi:MAG: hypothetical protein ACRDDX_05375 [Cellulosilyticaceae bacterium]